MWRVSYDSPVISVFLLDGWRFQKIPLYTAAVASINIFKESSALAVRANMISIKAVDTSIRYVNLHQRKSMELQTLALPSH